MRFLRYLPQNKTTLLLAILIITHLTLGLVWILIDKGDPTWDEAGHMLNAIRYFEALKYLKFDNYLSLSTYYPPGLYIFASIVLLFTNPSVIVLRIIILILFILSIYVFYLYVIVLTGKSKIALLSAFFYSFSPMVYQHSRMFMLEVPMLCLIIFILYLIATKKAIQDPKRSILLGLLVGISLLVKWTSFIFFLPELFFMLYRSGLNIRNFRNFLALCTTSTFVAFPWYFMNINNLIQSTLAFSKPEIDDPTGLSIYNLTFYLNKLTNHQVLFPVIVLFLIGSIYLFSKNRKLVIRLWASISTIYIVFTLLGNKNDRYTLPIILFVIVIGSYGFIYIIATARSYVKYILITLTISYYLINFLGYSFTLPIISDVSNEGFDLPGFFRINIIDYKTYNRSTSANYDDWYHDEILIYAAQYNYNPKWQMRVLPLVDKARFNYSNLSLSLKLYDIKNVSLLSIYSVTTKDGKIDYSQLTDFADFIVIPYYAVGPIEKRGDEIIKHEYALRELDRYTKVIDHIKNERINSDFELVDIYKLPTSDPDYLYLYKNNSSKNIKYLNEYYSKNY